MNWCSWMPSAQTLKVLDGRLRVGAAETVCRVLLAVGSVEDLVCLSHGSS